MPEGHTLLRLARQLDDTFAGRPVRVASPQGRFADAAEQLDGSLLLGAESAGKHLFVAFEDDRFVHVHLGLYGRFTVHRDVGDLDQVTPPVGQVRLRLVAPPDPGRDRGAAWADLRGATQCALVTPAEREAVLARIGPDPLRADADPDRAWQRVRRSRAPLGTLLMDQSVLAGVGNVYRAEVLFRQRLHPLRPGRTLRVGQWQALWDDLVELMADGVRLGRIDTVRPEDRAAARARPRRRRTGMNYVYRRDGEPCVRCGATVRTEELAGRNSFWCPRCQPVFRSRAVG